jgi:hypothetical protein
VFENRVLRRMCGLMRDEVVGGWRKLRNEKLHNLYTSPRIIRTINSKGMRWTGHAGRMEKKRRAYRVMVRIPEGRVSPGKPRRIWEDNIKIYLKETELVVVDWINLAQNMGQYLDVVNTVMNLRIL